MLQQTRRRSASISITVVTFICLFFMGSLRLGAQAAGTPINIGENKTGQVLDAAVPVQYSVTVAAPMSINVQLLAITPGFAPDFRVLDPSGLIILDGGNPGTQTIVQGVPNLSSPGVYIIEVRSANNTPGQYLISVQPGAPLAPPQTLTPGFPLNGLVSAQTTRQAYSFSGTSSDVQLLSVRSLGESSNPVVSLRDAGSGETLGLTSARLVGVVYRVPALPGDYLVEVLHSGGSGSESYVICLATESGSVTCPGGSPAQILPAQPSATPFFIQPTQPPPTFAPVVINPNGPCQVASARGQTINVRSGPGTNYSIVGNLPPNGVGLVLGRLPDNSWFQVNVNGILGWVSATVVILGGNCSGVSVVVLPTAIPTTFVPTADGATAIAIANATATQASINATASAVPVAVATLNFSLPPVYGLASLTSGFVPDPFTVGVTSGGSANVSYLGGCSGYTSSAPTFSVNYTSGAFPTLRFYFVTSAGDTTMVINSPGGSYICVDDSFGTTNPTVDFNSPSAGRYDIWIGTYADSTTYLGGTLYITENTGNHP